MPADGYWSTHWMKHPVGFGNVNARPSADLALTLFFKSDAPWNEAAWKNEKFDQLLVVARGETDAVRRAHRRSADDLCDRDTARSSLLSGRRPVLH